jgi:phage antirepressor YoqD-like protein
VENEMDLIPAQNNTLTTMSSREIAGLVEKRHDNVRRTMDALENKGLIAVTQNEEPTPGGGKPVTVYRVNKRDSFIVVAQLSPEFTARLVDRWQELESQQPALPDFSNPVAAARAWADAKESEQKALADFEAAKPAVDFVDRYVHADSGNKGFRQVAKLLQIKEPEFRKFLSDNKIMYRLGSEWTPHQNHIDAGRFDVKAGVAGEHAYNQAKFTPKGVNWVAGVWAQHQLRAQQEAAE